MTGAPLPPGADAVVMVEDTEVTEDGRRVRIDRPAVLGDAVRRAGDDVHKGDLLFPAGTELRPAVVGVLASVGLASVRVVSRPRVGVLSTGDELVEDGGPLGPGQIRESNRTMLLGAVGQAGCTPIDLGLVRDDEAALEAVLADAAVRCDAVVTSGGVSMGDFDIVKAVLGRLATMRWMQIAIRPAKPFAFGLLSGPDRPVPVFGLPGNPVSSLVSFELLARPALRQMMGHRHARPAPRPRRRRRGLPPPSRRQDALEPGHRPVRGRRALPRPLDGRPGQPPAGRRRPRPTGWPRCTTATASRLVATSTSSS